MQIAPLGADENFLGLSPEESSLRPKVIVQGIPFEVSTSYGQGTENGPKAIRAASGEVELYSHIYRQEPATTLGIATMPEMVLPKDDIDAAMDKIEQHIGRLLQFENSKLLVILGGEHSITPPSVRAYADYEKRNSNEIVVVQIDAHADLRDSYEGSKNSHACAARRIADDYPLMQIGIRNISKEGDEFRRGTKDVQTIFASDYHSASGSALAQLGKFVSGKCVYLTFDLDGLDCSIMPSTGTPEPGGLSWQDAIDIVRTITTHAKKLGAFDVVELAPIPNLHAPDFLAAKLTYEIIMHAMADELS